MGKNNREQSQRVRKGPVPVLCGWIVLFIIILNLGSVSIYARAEKSEEISSSQSTNSEAGVIVNIESIIQLVFGKNPEVVSSRYAREAAEFQFKDFERNLSQFTPLLFRSNVEREQRRYDEEQEYSTRVGMEKEFFDGSSIFTGVGYRGGAGDPGHKGGQFLETDITFPLFGSNTTLRRITMRSREENEMFNTRLEYVDTIRDNIRDAQFAYFDLLCYRERLAVTNECLEDYKGFLTIPRTQSNPVERRQVEGEIQSLQSEILRWKEYINEELLALQFFIGLQELSPSQISPLDLYIKDYYGKSYLTRTVDELLAEANQNDVKIRVLENARKNSVEKKQLAEQGKWDIFVDFNAQYDMDGSGGLRNENGYLMGVGLRIKRIDATLLSYSLRRAVAEINKYNALIRGQRLKTKNQIDREWFTANNRRKECEELFESVKSRRAVYFQKRRDYTEGKETVDNLITSRRRLMRTQTNLTRSLEGFYSSIIRLDHACGVYFTKLGINVLTIGVEQK